VIEEQHARGAGVLRRLSLGGGLNSVRSFDVKRVLSFFPTDMIHPRPFFRAPLTGLLRPRNRPLRPLLL
jgi:hypothetical protein